MPKNILIIEDDAEILSVLETVLTFNNFEVTGLSQTDDIIAAVKNHKPDLVLTDYMLPGLNGGRICQLIKTNEETKHIPVILISAYHEQAIALVNFGYDAFVPKPFDVNKLVKTINRFLN
ncbi:response regulator [Mucilaginibacter sp. CAU 1740]|jgi:DNA-binding response OmpR family regulator|uniref:response regulator n=1 Tax=Mucilaginibacter sp. CAU 1740 TaxID=3140365 RepID=UPI00325BCAAB